MEACRWRGSNPHGACAPRDFKSLVSAISPHRRSSKRHRTSLQTEELGAAGFLLTPARIAAIAKSVAESSARRKEVVPCGKAAGPIVLNFRYRTQFETGDFQQIPNSQGAPPTFRLRECACQCDSPPVMIRTPDVLPVRRAARCFFVHWEPAILVVEEFPAGAIWFVDDLRCRRA